MHNASNDEQWEKLYLLAKRLVERDPYFPEIEKQLLEQCPNKELVDEVLKQVKTVHYAQKRKNGLVKIGFGSLLLLVGFALTVMNFYSNESFSGVMYGFTSAGLLLLFWGLYDMFG